VEYEELRKGGTTPGKKKGQEGRDTVMIMRKRRIEEKGGEGRRECREKKRGEGENKEEVIRARRDRVRSKERKENRGSKRELEVKEDGIQNRNRERQRSEKEKRGR
jgi:hypothetical protein